MTEWVRTLWGLEFSGFVGWQLEAEPWVISQQELAACSHWTYFREQGSATPYPKIQKNLVCVCRKISQYTKK